MVIFRWFGQACFGISDSVTVVTDPHDGESVGLKPPNVRADIVTISHQHFDHISGLELVSKDEETITVEEEGEGGVGGVEIKGVQSYHDKAEGDKRGKNVIFVINLDEFDICHLGDLGHELEKEHIDKIGSVDILLIPVGGNYTIGAKEAINIVEDLNPSIVIPMHYKLPGLDVDISRGDDFLELSREKGWKIEKREKARIESLPEKKEIINLECQSI